MRTTRAPWNVVAGTGAAAVLIALIAGSTGAQAISRTPSPLPIPDRLESLTQLDIPGDGRHGLNRLQQTAVFLQWLAAEQEEPSPTTRGLGGGPITSGYIQEQLIRGLKVSHPYIIERLLNSGRVADAQMRDALILVLAEMSDRRQIRELRRVLSSNHDPWFRALAADNLRGLGAVESRADLVTALDDEFHIPQDAVGLYPVREAAEIALRILDCPDTLARVRRVSQESWRIRLEWQRTDLAARKPCPELQRVAARILSPGAVVNLVYAPAAAERSKLAQKERKGRARRLVRKVVSSGPRRSVASQQRRPRRKGGVADSPRRRPRRSSALFGAGAVAYSA